MNSLHIDRLEHAVQDIASYSRTVRTVLNAVIEDVSTWNDADNQTLPALESAINSVLHTNKFGRIFRYPHAPVYPTVNGYQV